MVEKKRGSQEVSAKPQENKKFVLLGETLGADEYKQAASNLSEFFRLLREWKDEQAHEQKNLSEPD